jgi:hypothetical protein
MKWLVVAVLLMLVAPLGYGIYASAHTKVAILIVVEGTVNGLTGVAATDYVAGLYFAALSAE